MIVNCVAYEEGRRLSNIERGEINDYCSRPNCFVWVALHDPDAEELSTFQDIFALHELAVEDALVGEQRPKVEEYGDALFVVTQAITVNQGEVQHGQLAIFAGPGYVLSVRQHSGRGFADVRAAASASPSCSSKARPSCSTR